MNAKTFIATTDRKVIRTQLQSGGSWETQVVLTDVQVNCFATDPNNPDVVYAGTQSKGLLRSGDRGATWQAHGLEQQAVKSIAVSRSDPGIIYAGAKPPGVFVTRDGGQSWAELESFRKKRQWWWFTPAEAGAEYVQGLAVSPTDPDVIVAGIEFGAVFRSTDGGKTWKGHLKRTLRDCHSLIFHTTNGDWVYEAGGSGKGVAFSSDGGKTWTQPKEGLDRQYGWACAADPAQPEIWYASLSKVGRFPKMIPMAHIDGQANAYIFRKKGDAPWEKLGGGLPQPLDYMAYALLTDPAAPGHLYAGLSNGDVWHSTDHGDNWRQMPLNLQGIHRSLILL